MRIKYKMLHAQEFFLPLLYDLYLRLQNRVIFEHISGNCRRLVQAGTAAMATSLLLTTKASADGIANI